DFQGGGQVLSSPVVADNRVYLAALRQKGLELFGALYCVNATTKQLLWTFTNNGAMKPVYSTPCLADGRLYIGEGFHTDHGCTRYCLAAQSGKKLWEFPTTSHTEGAPVVANGRVYFSAGDDGVLCVDAVKGTKVWQFPSAERAKKMRLHVDSRPEV